MSFINAETDENSRSVHHTEICYIM